jgi:quercetin dioxygenase-like cupin family protein
MSKRAEGGLPADLEKVLFTAIRPEPVEPDRAAALKARILERVRRESGAATMTLRAHEGEWIALGPKAEMKLLREDETSRSFLLRLHPGAVLPAHGHPMEEECLVLEGEVQLGNVIARAGDFHLAPKGVRHGVVRSEKGALLFLRGANPAHYAPNA